MNFWIFYICRLLFSDCYLGERRIGNVNRPLRDFPIFVVVFFLNFFLDFFLIFFDSYLGERRGELAACNRPLRDFPRQIRLSQPPCCTESRRLGQFFSSSSLFLHEFSPHCTESWRHTPCSEPQRALFGD